ncbi:hypothetical protein AAF712_011337 [Marasmius tenuissimus]|uniref:Glycoside hydrolase family 1 protein n=1 Tax=Marasmius tenuissimus TaxID=585030 RepID=A0ABR2ZKV0_9AGAR
MEKLSRLLPIVGLLFYSQCVISQEPTTFSGSATLTASQSASLSTLSTPITATSSALSSAASTGTVPGTISTTPTGSVAFPPLGAIPREYTPENLDELWAIVGEVEAPTITTTVVPETPIALPTPPPPLYPSFFPGPKDILPELKFPEGFLFGVDTAAFQVEGAVKNEGKGPTMWDWATRQPGAVVDNTTGDITDLQYFLYKEDTARVAALGVNAHSFSISWSRIFPFGTADSPVNQEGLDHYSDLIDYSLEQGVEPVVTLFHWDTPLPLQAYYGGFTSGEIVDDFVNYAKTVFEAYDGRVKTWYTFNEPGVYCSQIASYPFNTTDFAPGVNASTALYQCSYNLLKAHAGAVKAFREMGISGEIAFKNDEFVGPPWRANSTEDMEASERHTAFHIGLYAEPVYGNGDWPKIITDTLPPSFLPRLTDEDKELIQGSADFFAIDSYRTQRIAAPDDGLAACLNDTQHPLWPSCYQVMNFDVNGWANGVSADPMGSWLQATPNLLRESLRELQRRWPTEKMYISEFGFEEPFEGTRQPQELYRIKEDVARTNYFMTYLGEILLAIHEDEIPIAGAFAWAMVDNIEWGSGLSTRFGIQHVNYTTQERSYKRSAFALSEFFEAHLQ